MTKKTNTKQTISRTEVIAMHKVLEAQIEKLEDGMCTYKEGWSDQRVADELKCSIASVRNLRLEIFGKVRPTPGPGNEELLARVFELTRELGDTKVVLQNVLTSYEEVKDKHNKLVTMLSLNRVVDCKHLEVGKGSALKLQQGRAT